MSDSLVTPWTIVHQAPLSMGFPRQEYWIGLPFPFPGDLLDPEITPTSPELVGGFFTTEPPGKPCSFFYNVIILLAFGIMAFYRCILIDNIELSPHFTGEGNDVERAYSEVLLLLSRFSRVRLCATPWTAAYQASLSMGFSRQEHWSGLPFPSPMHESEKGKWSRSVVSLSDPMDCSLPGSSIHGIFQATVLEWGAIAFSYS